MPAPDIASQETVIHRFIHNATASESADDQVLDCCGDTLTYAKFLDIAVGIAVELREKFGERPIVSIISDNNPYVLAVILAVWLLGGVASPLDFHAPEALLKGMLQGVQPSCVILPSTSEGNVKLVKGAFSYILSLSFSF